MKIFNPKKAAVDVMGFVIQWGVYIVAAGFTVVILLSLCTGFKIQASNIPDDIEDKLILMPRFYNSGDCFAYVDEIGRVHTRVIDIDKFKQENMETCYSSSNANYAFSLSLEIPDIGINVDPVSTPNWVSDVVTSRVIEQVLVLHEGIRYEGELTISIKNVQ